MQICKDIENVIKYDSYIVKALTQPINTINKHHIGNANPNKNV